MHDDMHIHKHITYEHQGFREIMYLRMHTCIYIVYLRMHIYIYIVYLSMHIHILC